jgi:hypothetical protein
MVVKLNLAEIIKIEWFFTQIWLERNNKRGNWGTIITQFFSGLFWPILLPFSWTKRKRQRLSEYFFCFKVNRSGIEWVFRTEC